MNVAGSGRPRVWDRPLQLNRTTALGMVHRDSGVEGIILLRRRLLPVREAASGQTCATGNSVGPRAGGRRRNSATRLYWAAVDKQPVGLRCARQDGPGQARCELTETNTRARRSAARSIAVC